jgi:hypothetical protein
LGSIVATKYIILIKKKKNTSLSPSRTNLCLGPAKLEFLLASAQHQHSNDDHEHKIAGKRDPLHPTEPNRKQPNQTNMALKNIISSSLYSVVTLSAKLQLGTTKGAFRKKVENEDYERQP